MKGRGEAAALSAAGRPATALAWNPWTVRMCLLLELVEVLFLERSIWRLRSSMTPPGLQMQHTDRFPFCLKRYLTADGRPSPLGGIAARGEIATLNLAGRGC